jgi:transcriptional regulator with XRE-family HTH domain
MTQARFAERLGVHQSWISRIELGHGDGVPLALWIRIGLVIGQPLAVSFSKPLGSTNGTSDAGHLEIQEALLSFARATGRTATFELPTRPADPRHSIDVCVMDVRHRTLVIEEAWNTFGDFGAATRAMHRKVAEAADLAAAIDDGPPFRVASVWVVRDMPANRMLIGRYPEIVRVAIPGSSVGWTRGLTTDVAPPERPGLVWYDAATRWVHPWRPTAPRR